MVVQLAAVVQIGAEVLKVEVMVTVVLMVVALLNGCQIVLVQVAVMVVEAALSVRGSRTTATSTEGVILVVALPV